jgi:integrase
MISLWHSEVPPEFERFVGKNKIHPHALRHTVFTEAAREVDRPVRGVETLIKFTRHKDIRVAQAYIDATDDAASQVSAGVAASLDC